MKKQGTSPSPACPSCFSQVPSASKKSPKGSGQNLLIQIHLFTGFHIYNTFGNIGDMVRDSFQVGCNLHRLEYLSEIGGQVVGLQSV